MKEGRQEKERLSKEGEEREVKEDQGREMREHESWTERVTCRRERGSWTIQADRKGEGTGRGISWAQDCCTLRHGTVLSISGPHSAEP